tara:strand:+ start:496 stop:1527 length:1032 start_codon:yes stop_codon:yes gene_type:complete
MRIRTVKPEYHTSKTIQLLSPQVAYLGIALLSICDDEGYFDADPRVIKGILFPLRTDLKVEAGLDKLESVDFIQRIKCSKGFPWGRVCKFLDHQKIDPRRSRPSKIRQIFDEETEAMAKHGQSDDKALATRGHDDVTPPREQGTGNREQGTGNREQELNETFVFSSLSEALTAQKSFKMSETEKRRVKCKFKPDKEMRTLGSCFKRRPNTFWSIAEAEIFNQIKPSPDDCQIICIWYSKKSRALELDETNYWKSDLSTLLNQFDQQLDRAHSAINQKELIQNRPDDEWVPEPNKWREEMTKRFPDADPTKWTWIDLNRSHPEIVTKLSNDLSYSNSHPDHKEI